MAALCTCNKSDVLTPCRGYCRQDGQLCTSCLVDLLHPTSAEPRNTCYTADAYNFGTWILLKKVETVLHLQAVEAADLSGSVQAMGNIYSLYLLGIPQWDFDGVSQHAKLKGCRNFDDNEKIFLHQKKHERKNILSPVRIGNKIAAIL